MRRCLYATMAFALVTLLTLVKLNDAHHKAISDTPKLINKVYSTLESSIKDESYVLPLWQYTFEDISSTNGEVKVNLFSIRPTCGLLRRDGWGQELNVTTNSMREGMAFARIGDIKVFIWSSGPNGVNEFGSNDDIYLIPSDRPYYLKYEHKRASSLSGVRKYVSGLKAALKNK